MPIFKDQFCLGDEVDPIDSYFECITSCSIGDEGRDCVSHCIEIHLKSNCD